MAHHTSLITAWTDVRNTYPQNRKSLQEHGQFELWNSGKPASALFVLLGVRAGSANHRRISASYLTSKLLVISGLLSLERGMRDTIDEYGTLTRWGPKRESPWRSTELLPFVFSWT